MHFFSKYKKYKLIWFNDKKFNHKKNNEDQKFIIIISRKFHDDQCPRHRSLSNYSIIQLPNPKKITALLLQIQIYYIRQKKMHHILCLIAIDQTTQQDKTEKKTCTQNCIQFICPSCFPNLKYAIAIVNPGIQMYLSPSGFLLL